MGEISKVTVDKIGYKTIAEHDKVVGISKTKQDN